jgi:hypothetical protein
MAEFKIEQLHTVRFPIKLSLIMFDSYKKVRSHFTDPDKYKLALTINQFRQILAIYVDNEEGFHLFSMFFDLNDSSVVRLFVCKDFLTKLPAKYDFFSLPEENQSHRLIDDDRRTFSDHDFTLSESIFRYNVVPGAYFVYRKNGKSQDSGSYYTALKSHIGNMVFNICLRKH